MDSPKRFKDSSGHEWHVDLHLGNLDAIEDHAGFPLDSIIPKANAKADGDFLPWHEFLSDTLRIFDVFYALVKPQADALSLSKRDVKAGFATDETVELMEGATVQAVIDFFHRRNPTRAAMLRRSVEISRKLATAAADRVTRAMQKMNLDEIVDALPEISTEAIETAKKQAIEQSRKSASSGAATSA